MTATDLTTLRRNCWSPDFDPVTARLVLADYLQDGGDERAAIEQRICAEPDEDRHYLDLAGWFERNGDKRRGEYIRVALEVHAFKNGPLRTTGWDYVEVERKLIGDNEARWRAGPKCEACLGHGKIYDGGQMHHDHWYSCSDCHGTGDGGGLIRKHTDGATDPTWHRWHYRLDWHKGTPFRVHARLEECGKVERIRTYDRDSNGPAEYESVWVPSPWLCAVVRHHPTVREVRVTDREPFYTTNGNHVWHAIIGGSAAHVLPKPLVDSIGDDDSAYPEEPMLRYRTAELAHAALGRALVAGARRKVETS